MAGSPSPPHSLVSGEVAAALTARAMATPPGAFVEVGVYHGGTAWHLARAAEAQLRGCFLYDTFSGIPHRSDGDSHQVGDFKDVTIEQVIRDIPYALVIEGVFPGSAIPMGPIAFVHLDCDQYQSYREALEYFDSRMVKGGLIWCDDVPALPSAERAVREYAARFGRVVEVAEKAFIRY